MTCHVSIYPWALASNLTPYPLHLHPSHATYPGAPPAAFLVWPAQILSGGQKEAHVLVRRLVKEPPPELTPGLSSITYPSLLETPTSRIGLDVGALESVERTAWSQGPLEPGSIVGTPGGGAGDADFGAGRGDVSERNVQRLGLSCPPGKAQALSPPFQLGAPATQRCMLLTSSPGGHDVMLTWHVVSADGQAHLVLHEDAQPPGAVRNESDATLEVRKASEDGEEENVPTLVAPRHVAHFDWEGLAGLGGGGDVEEEMDEALLVQMRQGGRGVKLQIRVGNGPWSEPFNTDGPQSFECSLSSNGMAAGVGKVEALSEERKTESGRSGVVKGDEKAPGEKGRVGEKLRPSETRGLEDLLTVQVERQGATCCILVRRSERQSATENPEAETSGADRSEAESRTTQEVALPSNLAVSLSLGSLQAALYDDESRLLRGPVSAAETPPQNNPALAFLFTLDGLRLAASRVSSLRPVGLPPVTSYNCHVAVAALQLDNHLPGAKLPVILTVDLGETGLAAATLRGHPSSKTDPFPAARCSVIFSQPVPSPSAGLSAAWVQNLDVQIQPLVLNIDDSLLALITRLRRPHSPADALEPAAKSVRHPQSQGLLVRTSDLALADPQLYVHSLAVSDVRLALTACVTRPVVLDVRAAPVRLSELELRTVLFPSVVLARGILGHYVTEAICNVHRVVGSLELLFNPTGELSLWERTAGELLAGTSARTSPRCVMLTGRAHLNKSCHLAFTPASCIYSAYAFASFVSYSHHLVSLTDPPSSWQPITMLFVVTAC